MFRSAVLSLALLSTPALANGYYRAEPASPPTEERFVARDTVWSCGDSLCVSGESTSRPAVVCAKVVRKVGALKSFSADGRAFDETELANCNRRAR